MRPLVFVAFPLCAGLLAPAFTPAQSFAQVQPGLPAGACVVTAYGSKAVVTGPIPGGYAVESQFGYALRHLYDGLTEVPCQPDPAAGQPNARTAPAPRPAPPPGPAPAAPPPMARAPGPGGGPTLGSYHCVLFIPGSGLITQSGFTLVAGGRYTSTLGGGGTTRINGDTIEFNGGPLTGQAGKVSAGRVNLYNAARTRTVIDCDTKG